MERLLHAKETIKIMEAKLREYEKVKNILGEIEAAAKEDGVMPTKKDELDFNSAKRGGFKRSHSLWKKERERSIK